MKVEFSWPAATAVAVAVDDQGSVMWEGRWDVAALVWLVS
jgi:hypothetical protein